MDKTKIINLICISFLLCSIVYIYYYFSQEDTFIPKYPKEFDTFIYSQGNNECFIVHKNKEVMNFINESDKLSEHIFDSDYGVVRFMLGNKEVYALPYVPYHYPSDAYKIINNIKGKCKKYYYYIDDEGKKIKNINYYKVYLGDSANYHIYILKNRLTSNEVNEYGLK